MERFLLVLPYLLPLGVVGTMVCLRLTFSQVDTRVKQEKLIHGCLKGSLYFVFVMAIFFLGRWAVTVRFS